MKVLEQTRSRDSGPYQSTLIFEEHFNEINMEDLKPKRYLRVMEKPSEIYSQHEFKKRYRFAKGTVVNKLVLLLDTHEELSNRGLPLLPLLKMPIALMFYITSSFQLQLPRHLLGDSGYTQRNYVYTPVSHSTTQPEQIFNNTLK